ncbi:hypothetical protein NJB1907E19_26880, partial [Mycobacterium marinum]
WHGGSTNSPRRAVSRASAGYGAFSSGRWPRSCWWACWPSPSRACVR